MTHDKPGTHETKRDLSWPMWIPYIILLLMLAMTYSLWKIAEKHYQQQEQQLFKTKVAEAKSRIEMRLHNYEYTLHAGLAFMNASDDVTRADWQDFDKTLHTKHFYPGIQGLGYALMLKPAELKDFEKKMAQEYKGFGFFPAGERSEYSAIVYIEPQDARNKAALGYDMYSEPTRREAMQRARDLGVIAVSGGVKLVQEIDENMQQGILMYAPHYKRGAQTQTLAQRRDALLGYVYSPFRLKDLMAGTLEDFEGVDFELYDVSDAASGNLLYRSFDIAKEHRAHLRASELIVVGGREWRFEFRCAEELHLQHPDNEPLLFALFGLIISLLLFSFLYYLVRSRQKLNTINAELLVSGLWLEALLKSSTEGIHVLNRQGELVAWSRSFLQMLGYSESEAAGRGIMDWSTMHEAEVILGNAGHNVDEQRLINTLYRNTKGESIDVELAIRAIEIRGEHYLYCSSRETTQRKIELNELYLFRELINSSNDMIFILSLEDGEIEFANQAAIDLLGYSFAEMKAMGISGFRRPLDEKAHEGFISHLQELKAKQKMTDYAIVTCKNGREILIEANARALSYEGRGYNIAIVRDISKRKEAEDAILKEKEAVKRYLDIVDVMILVLDKDKNVELINRRGCEIIGYSAEEVIGKNWVEHFIPERFRQQVKVVGSRLLSNEKESVGRFENPVLTKSGEERLIAWRNTFLSDEKGNAIGILTSGDDITERKKTENELLRLSQVVGQNPYPVIITDEKGCIEYVNAAGVEQSGYSKEELLGKNMNIFNSGLHTEELYQELWRTIKEERSVWKGTIVDKMKNGELRDCRSTIFPLFDKKGRIVNFVSFKEDITERKIKDKLFVMQTRQAQMGEILSMIAHQWRQPLATINAISGKIRMREIFQEKEESVLVEDLCKIEEQSLYLSQTISDFRDLFHPDRPKEEIRLRTIIARAADLLDHSIKAYGITLEQDGDEEVRVLTYANEVLQVLITLIRNSIDAFVENEITERRISLTAGRNEAFATISLSDNAGGIKAEALQKIFLPYFTTKAPAHGTGLGLYMSKMLIEEHCEGKIEVEVDGTSGTVFTLSLPLPKEPR
ncbi:MAG: PAS domain S-box protein [Campylobacterales bacterium]|nr:PAS domain S-box protein [Campylobacterales bacterium]